MFLFKTILFGTLAVLCAARTTSTTLNEIPVESSARSYSSSIKGLQTVYEIYKECSSSDLSSCLKLKLLGMMERAARNMNSLEIIDGVSFVKSENSDNGPAKTEEEIEASLPRSLSEREESLNTLIMDKIFSFFESHTLQVKFPTSSELQRSLSEESRGKKKKMGGLLMIPLILGGTLVPLALGALALLAGKALIVSKLALVLAGIIGLKKLLGGGAGAGHETAHEVHVGGGHSGWGRSYEKEQAAQNLAYNAYAPNPTKTS